MRSSNERIFSFRYKLNFWDVGGQKSLRSFWRNYFESTDGLIWVVDSADKRRLEDCCRELHSLLSEEVHNKTIPFDLGTFLRSYYFQMLGGATLLVFANKQDLPGALSAEEIRDVSIFLIIRNKIF
jgi:ADP-ribosylation factor-like protein 2